jgi:hypothetical protein
MYINSTKNIAIITLLIVFLLPISLLAQIKIVSPSSRSVYQRDVNGQREITIAGTFDVPIDKIEVRAVPVLAGQGIDLPWTTLQTNPIGGLFSGNITLYGGWYSIEVKATKGNQEVGRNVLDRLGVGEVFIIAGQSNGQGLKDYKGAPGADEDRVMYISNYINDSNDLLTDPPRAEFSKLTSSTSFIAPRGQTPWCWGLLGDLLVKKLNLPVLFINTAWEGTAVENWSKSMQGLDTYNYYGGGGVDAYKYPPRMPYANLEIAAKTYGTQFGIRSILWIQGEADALFKTSAANYRARLQSIIDRLGADIGDKRLTWVISRTSRTSNSASRPFNVITSADVIGAQNAVIETPYNPTYPGPNTDDLDVERGDGTHFVGSSINDITGTRNALTVLANAWNNTLDLKFFSTVTPVSPSKIPVMSAACVSDNNAITLSLPEGYASYAWNTGQNTRSINVSTPGNYYATVKDQYGNSILSSVLTLNANAKPNVPTISPSGNQQACADMGVTFTANGTLQYNWFNSNSNTPFATSNSVVLNENKNFEINAQNIYGCVSDKTAPTKLVVHPKVAKPVIESIGPFTIQANTLDNNANQKFIWSRPYSDKDTTATMVKILKSGTYAAKTQVSYSMDNSTLVCYSDVESKNFTAVESNDVVFYPNPSQGGFIYIESRDDIRNATISVFDVSGRILTEETIPLLHSRLPISIKNLTAGKYIVRVTGQGLVITKSIMIR